LFGLLCAWREVLILRQHTFWYRKGSDLWTEFGKEAPFGRKFSSKDSAKMLAVGSAPSFGRRAVCA
jgi:hypothetical protein